MQINAELLPKVINLHHKLTLFRPLQTMFAHVKPQMLLDSDIVCNL